MSRVFITSAAVLCLVGCTDPVANDQVPGRTVEQRQAPPALKSFAGDEAVAKLPKFLREKEITSAAFAEAVNHYVDMGEAKAIESLKALAGSKLQGHMPDRVEVRMAFTCRVLFESKGKEPLRAPGFGGLINLPYNTMPLENWPLYPVVCTGSSHFVLSEVYVLGGRAEPSINYINYCCKEGTFRKDRVPVPTKAQALRDLQLLRASEVWKALKWTDHGQGFQYQLSENLVLEYLKAQAERIPSE